MRARPLVLVGLLSLVPARAVAGEPEPAEALLARAAPAVVWVHGTVARTWTQDGESCSDEVSFEGQGVCVSPTGILMIRNATVGGAGSEVRDWLRRNAGSTYAAAPSSARVQFAGEGTDRPAALLAQDSRLDLAFLQILDLGETEVPWVDLSKGSDPRIGQDLLGISRAARGFDFAPEVRTLYVSSRVTRPRPMWGARGEFNVAGLPVFATNGDLAGVLGYVAASEEATEGKEPDQGWFVLPREAVWKTLEAARKRVAEVMEKAAAERRAAEERDAQGRSGDAIPPEEPK